MTPTWAKNIIFLLVYMISGLVLVIIIEGLLTGTALTPLNTAIESFVSYLRRPFTTTLIVGITKLGNASVLLSATALIAVLLIMRRRYYDAALFVAAMILSVLSLSVLKNTFQIARPGAGMIETDGWSFPSGHATIATAFFFMLSYTFFRKLKSVVAKTFLITGSVVATLLICFSRLYLGAHWTLDVLAGIALGFWATSFAALIFGIFIENRRSLRNKISS
ncbi:MAG: hypothetical protein A2832_01115 [Candidatus Zambryskibacteria bacterium RIFCSPHIGHO2_01_FULL_44_22b]|uniref:Phosphatidic acid phosphatase type 2/haloperoxidase domain-containing protein n=2 Tax=Candidatus Zambryskiibacteriota TaxID=1817925 RepID=A0A1G2T0P7_9BACT|nr:MAG: hypothetical protein A2832_01115 [Candidatus Zambryskibacteria bacterium RIFCSPHIGHO2_01_FULL_44_22b]OHB05078.1 MAG: hypothetical protein A3B16_00590 [Candidatus Zambryskibacteria bacterium RIFCSPLOWO2_01_FULL_45_43]